MKNNTPNNSWRVLVAALTVIVMAICVSLIFTQHSDAAQPYGGCDEAWHHPKSKGAALCREQGWTIRKRLVINSERRLVYVDLRKCEYEDSPNCVWYAGWMGNARGMSFADLKHRTFYFKGRA